LKVLVLGQGAREHALGWLLRSQHECTEVIIHPGNAGTQRLGFRSFSPAASLPDLVTKAISENVQLVVIGPETLLEQGYADAFREQGIWVVGPNRSSAQLESSKVFAKQFMEKANIPTARFHIFESEEALTQFEQTQWPWVLKLDGLAAGKGVVIAQNPGDVQRFAKAVWKNHFFGEGPHRILAEDFLLGHEISYIGFCDGKSFTPLASATDYKRVFDHHQGANTGGMGAISPSPYFSDSLERIIQKRVIEPFLREVQSSGMDYRGILFVGLMVDSNGNPTVLEFNTRFGDPETQCVLPRFRSSFLSALIATATQELYKLPPLEWSSETSVYVVACAAGYPGEVKCGDAIEGLEIFPSDSTLFFAGVSVKDHQLVTQGGRVLGVGCLGNSIESARQKTYSRLSHLTWPGIHYRRDIGL